MCFKLINFISRIIRLPITNECLKLNFKALQNLKISSGIKFSKLSLDKLLNFYDNNFIGKELPKVRKLLEDF